jgi:membrane protein YqaA with SNARE-associated domain
MTPELQPVQTACQPPRLTALSLVRWFVIFALYLALVTLAAAVLMRQASLTSWKDLKDLFHHPGLHTSATDQVLKLLFFALYLSLCCTFVPLPTSWMVAAIATRQVALTGALWSTALLVGVVGAAASTMANLNDYHLFSLLLRHRRIAPVRDSRIGRRAVEWFNKAPFTLLILFNILPVPVDIARIIAATGRYPRLPFAAANLAGRFIRYAVLAGVCFWVGVGTVTATLIMLIVAVVLVLGRALLPAVKTAIRKVWPAM